MTAFVVLPTPIVYQVYRLEDVNRQVPYPRSLASAVGGCPRWIAKFTAEVPRTQTFVVYPVRS